MHVVEVKCLWPLFANHCHYITDTTHIQSYKRKLAFVRAPFTESIHTELLERKACIWKWGRAQFSSVTPPSREIFWSRVALKELFCSEKIHSTQSFISLRTIKNFSVCLLVSLSARLLKLSIQLIQNSEVCCLTIIHHTKRLIRSYSSSTWTFFHAF